MAKKKLLSLEVYDPTGEVASAHQILYSAGSGNQLLISVDKHDYWFSFDGNMLCEINVKKEDALKFIEEQKKK